MSNSKKIAEYRATSDYFNELYFYTNQLNTFVDETMKELSFDLDLSDIINDCSENNTIQVEGDYGVKKFPIW